MSPNGTDPETAPALAAALPEIPGYRIVRRLGEGGMAEIFLAIQLSLERQVAIKVLSFERSVSEADALRFEREARTIAKLDHPNIVGIFDVGRTGAGQLYYAMPYLARGDLTARELTGDEQGIAAAVGAICDALGYAHAQGIVHRDVKPENILFDHAGRARLADFGIALSREHNHRVTGPNKALGSSGYMSPEQARGQPLDGRSDLYGLGVVCYELLTGELPYTGTDSLAVALAHANDAVPRLPVTLRRWQRFIDKALAKDADQRFQTATEMRTALDALVRPPPATGEIPTTPSNHRRLLVLMSLLVLALAALGWTRQRAERGPIFAGATPVDLSQAAPPDSEPASEPPPIEGSKLAVLDAHALDDELKSAYAQLKRGRLFEPEGDNASERFLALYLSVPQSAEARAGLDAVVDQAAARAEKAIATGDGATAAKLHDASASLVERSRISGYAPWTRFEQRFTRAVEAAFASAERSLNADALASLGPALDIAAGSGKLKKRRAQLAAIPKPGQRLQDKNGPALVFVPSSFGGQSLDHAYALAATEVSRNDYLEFLTESKRALAKCRDRTGLFSYLRRRDVRQPGFDQGGTHPAVCVTQADAKAYAEWLSKRTGKRYRLPSAAEWRHASRGIGESSTPCSLGNVFDRDSAGTTLSNRYECSDGFRYTAPVAKFAASQLGLYDLVGNVSEWAQDCAADPKKGMQCQALGSSYRDGAKRALLVEEAQQADDAAPDLGFRVLRELTIGTLPAPMK